MKYICYDSKIGDQYHIGNTESGESSNVKYLHWLE